MGSEAIDGSEFNFYHARRRSNGNILEIADFQSKFEVKDEDEVFDARMHGPAVEEDGSEHGDGDGEQLRKTETRDSHVSSSSSSV